LFFAVPSLYRRLAEIDAGPKGVVLAFRDSDARHAFGPGEFYSSACRWRRRKASC